jgi:peptidoglycan/xylan/chitin deacetylase (PgdA/CDA1 family)
LPEHISKERYLTSKMEQILRLARNLCKGHMFCENLARRVLGTITHFSTRDSIAALTFDDGPHPEFTPELLKILERHKAQATFFMIGEAARHYPDLVKRVAEAGHAIGNHSYSHPSFVVIQRDERRRQIRECQKAIAPYGFRIFRPPHGHQNVSSRFDALLLKYKVVTWSVASQDWATHDVKGIVDRLESQIRPGSVILLHDSLRIVRDTRYADRSPMLEAVDRLLGQNRDVYNYVTLPEMFRQARPQKQNWYHNPSPQMLEKIEATLE